MFSPINPVNPTEKAIKTLIVDIDSHLKYYLSYTSYQVVGSDKDDKIPYYFSKYTYRGITIAASGNTDGNPELTGKRIANTVYVCNALAEMKTKLSNTIKELEEKDEDIISSYYTQIRQLIQEGGNHNAQLSLDYDKQHVSYQDNIKNGYSMIGAWFFSSWTKSRAQTAFENSILHLDAFAAEHKCDDKIVILLKTVSSSNSGS